MQIYARVKGFRRKKLFKLYYIYIKYKTHHMNNVYKFEEIIDLTLDGLNFNQNIYTLLQIFRFI